VIATIGVTWVSVLAMVIGAAIGLVGRRRVRSRDAFGRQTNSGDGIDAASDPAFVNAPILSAIWSRLSPRGRRIFAAFGVAVALLVLWAGLMAQTQLSTCETASGGVPSGDQRGFTLAFCGTPGAPVFATILAYALLAVVPLAALVTTVIRIGRRTRGNAWIAAAVGAALVSVPVGIAWLAAGAH
jgi:hypothetical protein